MNGPKYVRGELCAANIPAAGILLVARLQLFRKLVLGQFQYFIFEYK